MPHPQPQLPDQKLAADWAALSESQREDALKQMSPAETDQLATRLGWYGHASGIEAAPSPYSLAGLKKRALELRDKAIGELPNVGGIAGGLLGAGTGIETGPGDVLTAAAGSAAGGGLGEDLRQSLNEHFHPEDKPMTGTQAAEGIAGQAGLQGASELGGQLVGKALRPTTERTIAKLFRAGGLGKDETGALEQVMDDLAQTEKNSGSTTKTIGQFLDLVDTTKLHIGNQVDLSLAHKVSRGGKMIPLGDAEANTTPIADSLRNLMTNHPSETDLNPAKMMLFRKRAAQYAKPRSYRWLTDRRIVLNSHLGEIARMPPGEARVALLKSGELEADKAEADAIRNIIYPEMDRASGKPLGTTAKLQGKRGALIGISNAAHDNIKALQAKTQQAAGSAWYERGNLSEYGTTAGRPGIAAHKIGSMLHAPNYTARASGKVASAFGHTVGSKVAKGASTPLGMEIMSLPLRLLGTPDGSLEELEDNSDFPSLKSLREKAASLKPQGAKSK